MRFPIRNLLPLVILALAAGTSQAREVRAIDLTTEQRDRIREIVERHRSEGMADAATKSREAQRAARRILRDQTASEAAVREAYKKAAAAREELVVLRRRTRSEVLSVLTPEQRKELDSRSWRRAGRRRLI
jgi:Spy/CpxP family protein refolding chaperone